MATALEQRGYFSVLRWRGDVTRDEARNIAVILVDAEGRFGVVRSAPLSTISPRLREQGLLDAMLAGLEQQFAEDPKPGLPLLKHLHETLQHSLCLTEPQPVAVPDLDAVLDALYRAYAAPRVGGGKVVTKGYVLDRVVAGLRKRGVQLRRGAYVGDFIFDIVIDAPGSLPPLLEVLSFATPKTDWTPAEYDAGHFLYALQQVGKPGMAVVQPPSETSQENASRTYERVIRWFDGARVRTVQPSQVFEIAPQAAQQLPLQTAAR